MGKNRRSVLTLALAAALAFAAGGASAGQIDLYQRSGFEGRSAAITDTTPDVRQSAVNDVASSVVVQYGTWEACTEPYFHGTCARLVPGRYRNVGIPLEGAIVSVRELDATVGTGSNVVTAPVVTAPAPVAVAPAPVLVEREPRPVVVAPARTDPDEPRIVLYQHAASGIRAVELTSDVDDLATRSFAASADAAMVSGGVWRLCDDARGRGQCLDYSPGQYVTLGTLDRRVMSAYRVSPATSRTTIIEPAPRAGAIAAGRMVLYENPNYSGPYAVLDRRAPDLDWANFKNPAASFRVESGTWLVCSDMGYRGDCRVVGPGQYPALPAGMTGIVSAHQVEQPEYGAVERRFR
jgi:hypothetical protein